MLSKNPNNMGNLHKLGIVTIILFIALFMFMCGGAIFSRIEQNAKYKIVTTGGSLYYADSVWVEGNCIKFHKPNEKTENMLCNEKVSITEINTKK